MRLRKRSGEAAINSRTLLCAGAILCILSAAPLSASEIYIAPLGEAVTPQGQSAAKELLSALDKIFERGDVHFMEAARDGISDDSAPESFLDAMRMCQSNNYEYLIYGFVRPEGNALSAGIKLISSADRKLLAEFYASDDTAHGDRLMSDLAIKIYAFFIDDLGWTGQKNPLAPPRNFSMGISGGIWSPIGAWSKALVGAYKAEFRLRFVPLPWLYEQDGERYSFGLCLRLGFALGLNAEGYEPALLYCGRARFPVDYCCSFGKVFSLSMGAGPMIEYEFLDQSRRNTGEYCAYTLAGGFSAFADLTCQASPLFSFGVGGVFDFIFFEEPLYEVSPELFVCFSLGAPGTRLSRGKRAQGGSR